MKQLLTTILIMLLTGLSIFINLAVFNNIIYSFACYYLGFALLLPCLDLLVVKRKSPRDFLRYLGLSPTRRDLLIGLVCGVLIFGIILLAVFFLKKIFFRDNTILESLDTWGIPRQNIVLVFIVMLTFNGALEEVFWRGYIHRRLEGVGNRAVAISLPVLFFTAQHIVIITSLITNTFSVCFILFAIFLGGVIWQITREYTKSALPCVIGHVSATAGYMTVFYLFVLKA